MGMLISVVEKPSAKHGIVRFETNRALTGMAHERYKTIEPATPIRSTSTATSSPLSFAKAARRQVWLN
jgi:hypothetical protein